jgi:integrase
MIKMAGRRLPRYVYEEDDRHGKRRVYFRRDKKSPRIALPLDIRSREFGLAYAQALSGNISVFPSKREAIAPNTIGALILSYQKSASYIELRDTTKRGYQTRLEAIRANHADKTLSGLTADRIQRKILEPYAGKPAARLDTLKKLRILINHARSIGWLQNDPSHGIKRPKIGNIRSWTDAEIEKFEARWPVGTKERLAYSLFLYTGQRISDIHRMTWANIARSTIAVTQQKTGTKLEVPLHVELRRVLLAAPRKHVTILNTAFEKPFTVKGFGNFMRNAISGAGLPMDCSPHGLRKAAARRLAEAECSAKQIMSITGHKTMSEAQRYVDEADQKTLAIGAIKKLEADQR